MKVKCKKCNGNKHIVGLGYVKSKCEECDGAGWFETKQLKAALEPKPKKKRRGRPPKKKDAE